MPLPFYEDCINHGCLQSGPQQQETGAAGATMEHTLTDLGSQAGPHLSDAYVETASESDTMGIQEREGDIEEPGTPGERMVSAVGIAGCGWEAGTMLGTCSAASCLAGQGGSKVSGAMAARAERHQLSGI